MTPNSPPRADPPRVAVVGAGVLGLACGLRLAQAGARVTLYEAAPQSPNASRVAAGMIAPAAECAVEPPLREVAAALRDARDAWSPLAAELDAPLLALGSRHRAPPPELRERRARLEALGFVVQAGADGELFTPQDALISPVPALAALRRRFAERGGDLRTGRVAPHAAGFAVDGAPLDADAVVLAVGAPGLASRLAPELAALHPVKGQLVRWANPSGQARPTLRTPRVYLATSADEVVAGATLEPGRDDLEPDPAAVADLREAAVEAEPALAGLPWRIEVGVRAQTPDGLPLAGPSAAPGVWLAAGAGRNGWLFAPSIAAIVAAQVLGRPLGALAPLADRLHPRRIPISEVTA